MVLRRILLSNFSGEFIEICEDSRKYYYIGGYLEDVREGKTPHHSLINLGYGEFE
jgi:hypothetical protein